MGTTATPPTAPPVQDLEAILSQTLTALKGVPTSVSLTTDIGAACNCVSKLCDLAMTEQGQLTLKQWREDGIKISADLQSIGGSIWDKITGLFKINK